MVTKSNQDTSNEAAGSSTPAPGASADDIAQSDPAANALPAAIIAQAESAIYGQFEPDDMPPVERRASRATIRANAPKLTSRDSHRGTQRNILSHADTIEPPPAYGEKHDQLELSQDGFDTKAKVTDDGRINININQKTRKLSDLLVPALRNQLQLVADEDDTPLPPGYIPPALGGLPGQTPPPKLNVVIHVVGSRGDVQPFVALGKVLKSTYGHRVRLATHPTFKDFIEENGLEFFSIGGDPAELMAFMVKNPGLMPGLESLKSGDVGKRRKGMEEIVLGCWRSCIEAGDGLGPALRSDSSESLGLFDAGINMDTNPTERPFIADAIIANPPSFAHIHIAEKMGIPLHMMFTMPWSPTQQFPHPLANIQSSNADVNMTNFVSYALVEMMTWQGLGDVINRFRERALGLDPISLIWAPGMLTRLRVPYTYCWSPALIPKPKDWGQHISISGFYFLDLACSYTPAPDLAEYLAAGPPPIYIGFGSIVVDDPDAMTKMIFEAVKIAGVRALVSKGWGGLGADALGIPDGVFMLGNVPHDWLFQHVAAVVHHGGAGTTAAGIATGKPTVVVPFFGDQPFWGAMVARAGAGPVPIPYKQMTAEKLAASIAEALKPETSEKAKEYGLKIKEENGCEVGGKAFHDQLHVDDLRCTLSPSRVAVWRIKRTQTRLSALAANVLAGAGLLDFADLKLQVLPFPANSFKAESNKESTNNSSGSETPANNSRSTSQVDLSLVDNDSIDPLSPEHSQQADVSTPSAKTSYESTERSSIETHNTDTPLTSTTSLEDHRGNSLKKALRGTLSRSRSNSRDRSQGPHGRADSPDRRPGSRSGSRHREVPVFNPSNLTIDNAVGAAKGAQRIVAAGMKSPMDFTLGIARGFHNAPKLYGDDTVRPQEKVTDFQSGLKAAGKEFGYGFYDGISGLITQPIRGAEKEGAAGLFKGIGKGIGGLILKPGAAIWGLPGYTFMGIHKEVRKLFGSSVLNYMISARTAQGFEEYKNSTLQERQDIISRWREHKLEYVSSKQKLMETRRPEGQESGRLSPRGFLQTRHLSFEERKKLHDERKLKREEERHKVHSTDGHRSCPFCSRCHPHTHTPRAVQTSPVVPDTAHEVVVDNDPNVEFENAIHASVAATSRGNVEEDLMIERAIRASIKELQNAGGNTSDAAALSHAIEASIAEATRRRASGDPSHASATDDDDAEHQMLLEKAIQESIAQYQIPSADPDGDIGTDDDEAIKQAIEKSKAAPAAVDVDSDEDEDIRKAIEKSKEIRHEADIDTDDDEDVKLALEKSKSEHQQALSRAQTEEEIVLAYVKKQSLAEEEHKRKAAGKEKEAGDSAADEEALNQAIAESMKAQGGNTVGEGSGA
ncbi:UDP-glucose:sterol glucosyltransferase 80B1 [Hyphodiscus hymeniophilus]|uniref:UDP-glucose:sterol glucosyltransferase 80B1 n=1 Tax=Hyphodiscus hymeniophilus TaxID=353542 RepID=A0A9P6VNS5_9HELO|nr:UDP-glucose:sterol glucosyltransferase 80B1 [Hyphodiscus hymeniophilus]